MTSHTSGGNCTRSIPSAGTGAVQCCREIHPGFFSLKITLRARRDGGKFCVPRPGQFFMLRSRPSSVLLCRPVSVYRVHVSDAGSPQAQTEFLILKKGTGTAELCALKEGSEVDIIGPLGNTFPAPASVCRNKKAALVGGGIGIAPVAGFAHTLPPGSYDLYACFRSGSYGLDGIHPRTLTVTTDDGSCGTKGMLPAVFGGREASACGCVYACGPEPMLKYVRDICLRENVPCYLSLVRRMACGLGACLGCTVETVHGNRRCCADGPVFSGKEVLF